MSMRLHPFGFSIVQILIAVVLVAVGIALFLPTLGSRCGGSPQLSNSTQLRGIQQGFVVWAQSNKTAGADGFFPGFDAKGDVLPDGEATGHSGDGNQPAARLWMMLNGGYFTPDYLINPADPDKVEVEIDEATGLYKPLTAENFSYALLGLIGPDQRKSEWKESLNTSAVVLSDRAIGTGRADLSSVWIEAGSGDWRGGVTRNDNSTAFETVAEFEKTKYGSAEANEVDHLFEDAPDADDAFLVHADATTAYSAE